MHEYIFKILHFTAVFRNTTATTLTNVKSETSSDDAAAAHWVGEQGGGLHTGGPEVGAHAPPLTAVWARAGTKRDLNIHTLNTFDKILSFGRIYRQIYFRDRRIHYLIVPNGDES